MNHPASKCAGAVCTNVAVVTKGTKRFCHACTAFIEMDHSYAPYKRPDREYERANADYREETIDDLMGDLA